MNTSLFELFKIGIGPSSSHTVGPMRAALRFVRSLDASGLLARTGSVRIDLYGSLALTGIGHGTDRAILLGLLGEAPDTVDPTLIEIELAAIRTTGTLYLLDLHEIPFTESQHLLFHRDQMYPNPAVPTHPNGMRFSAFDDAGTLLAEEIFYSIGGGFILSGTEFEAQRTASSATTRTVPYPFRSADELLSTAAAHNLTIAQLMLSNEVALLSDSSVSINRPPSAEPLHSPVTPEQKIKASILTLWHTMQSCTARGIATEGILPGGLNVRRRAPRLVQRLETEGSKYPLDPLAPLDWVTVYAMAVNEENAAGGRVVTAPTNGAAGVIPAIAHFYMRFTDGADEEGLLRYFLTAAAIGILYKENASISGAEVGCQGEVGVACSMAAGGLVAALNGTNAQVEHAAEIAMEHNLGMTCDPIGGLVQIPCIERNGMGAVKAINATRMAMHETGGHKLSLDQIIATMYQTGLDMQSRYKETSLAGLALNIIEC
ncbi:MULTISPECIES: L-serine ammonia-lyase [Acidobacteriaceae]|uniref:L-serine ammonia-lyase n=1 Tax=Acidobacteriaceae TaxID=204434 RepID=UPI00131D0FE8|nr:MULTISPECIES: L-serine ammonia-lyase [Acidobacteriaceae]MDW5264187.1 L-serine ammonia-lyase [Edaphobacter sp.]